MSVVYQEYIQYYLVIFIVVFVVIFFRFIVIIPVVVVQQSGNSCSSCCLQFAVAAAVPGIIILIVLQPGQELASQLLAWLAAAISCSNFIRILYYSTGKQVRLFMFTLNAVCMYFTVVAFLQFLAKKWRNSNSIIYF